ncbi:predicted protein [Naegleria gruberi]|uniref:Predicted protein n=1 Tax=Naegleria gruberi TaxID=5762 RepID=D2VC52_NAEGR|nr:uncharacterized protein NAEGRDRAFT_66450 [Naegleria gruberi]EFC45596.1 predicted protein [Naegleria gruberi]|eukprot:XP_002678340.1 predicted protein [Naegleria gruberi strain NEG-M]
MKLKNQKDEYEAKFEEQATKLKNQKDEYETKLADLKKKLKEHETGIQELKEQHKTQLEEQMDQYETQLEEQLNQYQEQLEEERAYKTKLEEQIESMGKNIQSLSSKLANYEFDSLVKPNKRCSCDCSICKGCQKPVF